MVLPGCFRSASFPQDSPMKIRRSVRAEPAAAPASALRVSFRASFGLGRTLIVAGLVATAQAAPAQPSLSSGTVMDAVERLRPGEYLWAPDVAPQGPMLLVVNLSTQRLVLYRNGLPIAISTVSSGKPGHVTPTGVFTILQRHVDHRSNIYANAPMPYMQRLTWQGVALHGGNLPGYPASHGCIRLPQEFARLLYGETRLGMTVVITQGVAVPRIAPTPDLLQAGSTGGTADPVSRISWHPERSPAGPVSIIISGADRRVMVLRNGRVIGSAPVEIEGAIDGTSAYVLRSMDPAGHNWLRIPLPGQAPEQEISPQERGRFRVAGSFRAQVLSVLRPGTTVLVTGDSLSSGGTGEELTVIADDRAG
jgi:hypothetical protein